MLRSPLAGLSCLLLALSPAAAGGEAAGADPEPTPALIDFAAPGEAKRWAVVNDGVMGGKSEGHTDLGGDALRFHGEIVTDGGGFTSIRRRLEPGALAGASGLTLRVKTDGRGYRVTLRDGTRVGWGGEVMYAADVPAAASCGEACVCGSQWRETTIDFDDLTASFHGRPADVEPFDPADARQIGLILADGVDGGFEMRLAWIRADR